MLWGVHAEQRQAEEQGRGQSLRVRALGASTRRSLLGFGYSALLGAGLALSAPWWLLRMATTARYREGLAERLGRVPARLRAAVAGRRVVWVHAVSVGEVLAVARLVAELKTALSSKPMQVSETRVDGFSSLATKAAWQVVISTTTRTGQALARERFGAERVFYLPLDFGWAVRAYLRVLRPALVVLAESEIWPRLLHECGCAGVPVAVVNARVSDRSLRRGLRVRRVWGRMLRGVSLWLAQSEEDAARLVRLGARAETVRVSGNLKYDVRAPGESRIAELVRNLAAGRQIVIAGSTLEDKGGSEDSAMIRAWEGRLRDRGVLLVLAPRHPERFSSVYSIATQHAALRATEMLKDSDLKAGYAVHRRERDAPPVQIVVLDTIGDLAAVYRVADVAFVGGSLVPEGGHNPLEPARFGVPVVMGESYENFRDVVEAMKAARGILIVNDERNLAAALDELLGDREAATAMGERGRQAFVREGGATARSIQALMPLIRKAASPLPTPGPATLTPEAASA